MMNESYFDIVERVWEEDGESQTFFFESIKEVRHSDFNPRGLYSIFIPNEKYLLDFTTESQREDEFGLFRNGTCIWTNQMILPLCDILGVPRGIVSFDPFVYLDVHNGETGNYYIYSSQDVCPKGNFLYAHPESFKRGIDSYLFITDGVFDTVSLYEHGFNAGALMGSTVSDIVIAILQLFPKVVLIRDNDEAGALLKRKLSSRLLNFVDFSVQGFKDIDEALKSDRKEEFLKSLTQLTR